MELEQNTNDLNDYTWHGLTKGKLLAIIHALEDVGNPNIKTLTTLQHEVLDFLYNVWDERRL